MIPGDLCDLTAWIYSHPVSSMPITTVNAIPTFRRLVLGKSDELEAQTSLLGPEVGPAPTASSWLQLKVLTGP
jgi:hypothetical protein